MASPLARQTSAEVFQSEEVQVRTSATAHPSLLHHLTFRINALRNEKESLFFSGDDSVFQKVPPEEQPTILHRSTRTTSLNEVKSQPILQSPDLTSQRSPCIYLNLKGFLALTSSNKRIRSAGTRGTISSFCGSGNTTAFYWGNQEAAVIDMAFGTTWKTKQTETVVL
ncbi:hypothetical protein CDAR_563321 [Caerostris darwini]|uniref:Uncharacterized protein n=1 Tax=Caerostris darwini TaxID=1538125 RepID=A0AAV4QX58_9ARAC|nr:hypothetical protein CDAR_563321 [Caerostris darwini]